MLAILFKSGWNFGLLLGLIDLCARLWVKNFDWYELYLALLLPALLLALGFMLSGGLVLLSARIGGRSLKADQIAALCYVLRVGAAALIAFGFFLLPPGRSGLDIFAAVIVLSAVLVVLLRWRFRAAATSGPPGAGVARRMAGQLSFFAVVFIVVCGALDLYEQYNWLLRDNSGTASSAPNVVLLSLDTVRPDFLTLYQPNRLSSPFLAELAERSVVFTKAVAPSSWTLPSHATLFTGLNISEHGAHGEHQRLGPVPVTLAELLQAEGYETVGFVGGPFLKRKFGLARGFESYRDRLDFFEYGGSYLNLSLQRLLKVFWPDFMRLVLRADGERSAPEINRDISRWLVRRSGRPFFMFVNYFDAHDPYDLGEQYRPKFTNDYIAPSVLRRTLREADYAGYKRFKFRQDDPRLLEYMRACYQAEIRWLDDYIREFFALLHSAGVGDNTLVVITSDHGEEFGEHGGLLHQQTLYQEVIAAVLLFHFPGQLAAREISQRVGLIDIPPTILALLGLPVPESWSGVNILGPDIDRPRSYQLELRAPPSLGDLTLRGTLNGDMKRIEASRPNERTPSGLYNLAEDPGEQHNLYGSAPPALGHSAP